MGATSSGTPRAVRRDLARRERVQLPRDSACRPHQPQERPAKADRGGAPPPVRRPAAVGAAHLAQNRRGRSRIRLKRGSTRLTWPFLAGNRFFPQGGRVTVVSSPCADPSLLWSTSWRWSSQSVLPSRGSPVGADVDPPPASRNSPTAAAVPTRKPPQRSIFQSLAMGQARGAGNNPVERRRAGSSRWNPPGKGPLGAAVPLPLPMLPSPPAQVAAHERRTATTPSRRAKLT